MKQQLAKIILSLITVGGLFLFGATSVLAQVDLYTPYTGLSVTPGESINYSVDVNNQSSSVEHLTFDINDLPEEWSSTITSGGNDIRQLSVDGNGTQTIDLEIRVPLQVEKGDYHFELVAKTSEGSKSTLPFLVEVSEKGTFDSEINVDQPNLEGHTTASFTYSIDLRNRTANEQNYSLNAQVPAGWGVQFTSGSDSITSVTLEPGEEGTINVDVTPAEKATADTYEIPIQASASGTSAEATLEAVITGSYALDITTPDGRLSTDITAGRSKTVDLLVKNTGTATLNDVKITASTPPNWESEFDNSTIPTLEAGDTTTIKATLTASDDAIAGDYEATFSAEATETSANAAFRVSVEASTLWGLIGIAIILAVLGGLYYLFRKYGRR